MDTADLTATAPTAMQGIPEDFPPELCLVLGLLRVALRTGEIAEISRLCQGMDWTAFGPCVDRHRVGAFLHHRLPPEARSLLPETVTQHLQEQSRLNVRRALTQAAEVVRLVKLLEGGGIPVLSLKGPLLAQEFYGELGQRHAGDIDLLVAPENASRADRLLRGAGYRRVAPDFDLTPLQEKCYLQFRHEFSYLAGAPRPRMEMMWQLEQFPNLDDAWRRAVKQELGGHQIHILPPDLNAHYLFQHGARHAWFRLFWLVDVSLLLARDDINWDDFATRARSTQMERPLQQGARLAGELLGVAVPPALLPAPIEQRKITNFAADARHWMMLDAATVKTPFGFFRQLVYNIRLQQGWRAKYNIFRQRLLFVDGWKLLRLPDWCFVLYYPAMPFLCLYSLITGGRKSSR